MSKEILENLNILLEAVKAQPEELFSLDNFRRDHPCGSNFCTIGLATTMPHFIEKGYTLVKGEAFTMRYFLHVRGAPFSSDVKVVDWDFGERAWPRLFESAGMGEHDFANDKLFAWWYDPNPHQPDERTYPHQKDLAIWRLERQIAEYTQ